MSDSPEAVDQPTPTGPENTDLASAAKVLEGLLGSDEQLAESQAVADARAPEPEPEEWWRQHLDDRVTVKVDGVEQEVPLSEALNGYMRQSAFTRRTQAAAEQRKRAEAEMAEARRLRDLHLAQTQAAGQALDSLQVREPDWGAARQYLSPEDYVRLDANFKGFMAERQRIATAEAALERERAEDEIRRQHARLETESEALKRALPDWSPEDAHRLRTWLETEGWDPERVAGIMDHREVVALERARRYSELQAQRPRVEQSVRSKIKTTPPSAGTRTWGSADPKPAASRQKDLERLRQSGRIDDAARALRHLVE